MDDTRQRGLVIVSAVTWSVSAIVILLRFISRRYIVRIIGLDDWFMLAALVFFAGYMSTEIYAATIGLGLHTEMVSEANIMTISKVILADGGTYHTAIYFAKTSIVIFYLRFIPPDTNTRRACWILIGLMTAMLGVNIIVFLFPCTPLERFWNPKIPGTCIDLSVFLYASACFGILTDFIIFVLPLRWLNTIKRSRTDRLLIIGLFGFSLIGCLVSIARVPSIHAFTPSDDPVWNIYYLAVWTHVETSVCIFCGCAPALKPLYMHIFRRKQQKVSETLTGTLELSRGFYDLNRRSIHEGKGMQVTSISVESRTLVSGEDSLSKEEC